MGGCCSNANVGRGDMLASKEEEEGKFSEGGGTEEEEDGGTCVSDGEARVWLKGSCPYASMFTQQGRKGVNQDAMTIWEGSAGDEDYIFCGVFDGHGPFGHKVAGHVRDVLPAKLNSGIKTLRSLEHDDDHSDLHENNAEGHDVDHDRQQWFSSLKAIFTEAFQEVDTQLEHHSSIECIYSGSTAVSIILQSENMLIANLGDSRAILCTRDGRNQLIPVQLTVDLKPDVPSEAERISSCRGRIFALAGEPDVHRLWLPSEDSPGLAMARAFGDFCLKNFGLISTPLVSYRKLSEKDQFVVLATDGVWDVLSNKEVVKIVSSARKRSEAAKEVVERAVQAWRRVHPTSKVDDCSVICLFLNIPPPSANTSSDSRKSRELSSSDSFRTARSGEASDREEEINSDPKEEWTALNGVSRANSLIRLPRFGSVLSWRKRSVKVEEQQD